MSKPTRYLCIFEDDKVQNLLPLVYMRPVFDLRCGILTLREKMLTFYPGVSYRLWCRPEIADVTREQNPMTAVNVEDEHVCLFVNGRVVMDDALSRILTVDGPDCLYWRGRTLVAARVQSSQWQRILSATTQGAIMRSTVEQDQVNARLVEYPWDLIGYNPEEIRNDYSYLESYHPSPSLYPGAHFIQEQRMSIGQDTVIMPGSVLDAREGPIFLGDDVQIFPHTYIKGPVCIGDSTIVKAGAAIYPGTTIGPVCRVGGEIDSSILHGYANKQHHGFLGHSYVGQWVNLGAGTTTSNLKNTYGTVTVERNGERIDTYNTFVGLFIGDHAKTAINTTFNTGTLVGFSSNVAYPGIPPKFIPSFCWYGPDGPATYQPDKAMEVARRVMRRRQAVMNPAEAERFKRIFDETAQDRARLARSS